MAEREKNSFSKTDLIGLVLFVPGAFLLVLVVMDLVHSGGAGATGRLASAIVAGAGSIPPLAMAVGLGAIGVAVYLRGEDVAVGRHVGAVVGIAAGSSVLLGAVAQGAGGALGSLSGGWIAARGNEFVGVLVGLAATCIPVWLFWLRPARAGAIPAPSAPRGPIRSDLEADGVSSAEAEALVPDERFVSYMEQVWRHARAQTLPKTAPPSPYPEDVRRRGQIPPGAKPLATHAEPPEASSHPTDPEPPVAAAAAGGSYVALGKDLAPEAPVPAPARAGSGGGPAPRGQGVGGGGSAKAPLGYRAFFDQEPPRPASASSAPVAEPVPVPAQRQPSRPPRPTWEAAGLFDASDSDAAGAAPAPTPAVAADSRESARALAARDAANELDEELPDDDPPDDEDEGGDWDDGGDDSDGGALALDEDEDEDEDAEAEDFGDAGEDDAESAKDDDAAEWDDGEAEDDEDLDAAAELAEEDGEDLDAEDLDETEEDADDAPPEESETTVPASRAARAPAPHAPVTAAPPETDAETGSADEPSEPEVVLEPRPRRPREAARREPAPPPARKAPADHEELVLQAGLLFLQHGRVAVSLLQRHFGIDFDRACELLDELQERGLIGPYLGGQRRDILLSAEQWTERVGSS